MKQQKQTAKNWAELSWGKVFWVEVETEMRYQNTKWNSKEFFETFFDKMFVSDIRKDFFDVLQHERILLIANLDVDAVCAVKILQTLLQCDNVQYTLVPVQGKADLIRAFEDNGGEDSGVRYAVLVNCGASVDLVDFLDPPEDLVIFVADSHRPIDVCNAYNDGQIRLLALPEDIEEIPKYEDVFRDGEGNDFGNDDNGDSSESDENSDYRLIRAHLLTILKGLLTFFPFLQQQKESFWREVHFEKTGSQIMGGRSRTNSLWISTIQLYWDLNGFFVLRIGMENVAW